MTLQAINKRKWHHLQKMKLLKGLDPYEISQTAQWIAPLGVCGTVLELKSRVTHAIHKWISEGLTNFQVNKLFEHSSSKVAWCQKLLYLLLGFLICFPSQLGYIN